MNTKLSAIYKKNILDKHVHNRIAIARTTTTARVLLQQQLLPHKDTYDTTF